MIEHVRAVDGGCRAPGCETPAHKCDIDHRVPYPAGRTHVTNLGPLDRRHHNPKTAGACTLEAGPEHAETGALIWTTLAGREYITYPKNYREAVQAEERHAAARHVETSTPEDHSVSDVMEDANVTDVIGNPDVIEDAEDQTSQTAPGPELEAVQDDDPPPF